MFLPRASEFPVSLLHSSPSHLHGLLHDCQAFPQMSAYQWGVPDSSIPHPSLPLISRSDKFHFHWKVRCLSPVLQTPPVYKRQVRRSSTCLWVWEEEEEKPKHSLLLWISVLLDFLQPTFTIWSCHLEARSESSLDTGSIRLFFFFTESAWIWQALSLECRGSCLIILSFGASAQVQRWKVKLHSMCC